MAGGNLELLREERLRRIEKLLNDAISEAQGAGITSVELHEMLSLLEEGK